MSVLSKAPRPSGDDVKRVAMAALAAALDEGSKEKPAKQRSGAMKGVRTVAAGAALFVAGRAALKNGPALIEQFQDGSDEEEEAEAEEDEDCAEEDEEEPEAEEDEDFDEEDDGEEPEAEEDEDFDEEDDGEEPEAEEDEDLDEG